jgi:phenylacetate-coenzyme A ligase PaaK-like adenylate-forming protein
MIEDLSAFKMLDYHHRVHCGEYGRFHDQEFPESHKATKLEEMPFLPISAFKYFDLKSIADNDVYRVMFSSGTSGRRSKVFLDRSTAKAQATELAKTLSEEFGGSRFPMITIQPKESSDTYFTASKAAQIGFSVMATKSVDCSTTPTVEEITSFEDLRTNARDGVVIIFGFTYNVWSFLSHLKLVGIRDLLPNSILIHGGGWKKLEDKKVSASKFSKLAKDVLGAQRVANYYGLVEQTGTIFLECKFGNKHEPAVGAVIVRDPRTLHPLNQGEVGLIQVISSIQYSYPGHSILTEDLGSWSIGSDCPCGNQGRILQVVGRAEHAEVRGCSDAQLS